MALNSSNCVRATHKQLAKSLGYREVKGHAQGYTAIQSWLEFEPVPVPLRFAGLTDKATLRYSLLYRLKLGSLPGVELEVSKS